jgi:Domain of Unknown Function (DUF1080)
VLVFGGPRFSLGERSPTVKRACPVALLLLVCAIHSGSKPSPDGGWARLFNGKDLSGWRSHGQEKWVVDQGTILSESAANKYGYLATERTYRDFDLRLKFKGEAAGNSGVFLRSKILGIDPEHGPDIEGMQVEVDPTPGKHTGGLYESGGRGWVSTPPEQAEQALKIGEWNELEVQARSNHIVTTLNGTKMVDFTDASPRFTEGAIALQIHTGGGVKVRWKDIEIRER